MKDLNLSVADVSLVYYFGLFLWLDRFFYSAIKKITIARFKFSVFTIWIDINGGYNPWSTNLWEINRFSWSYQRKFLVSLNNNKIMNIIIVIYVILGTCFSSSQTMWIINVFFISGWFSIAFAKVCHFSVFFLFVFVMSRNGNLFLLGLNMIFSDI